MPDAERRGFIKKLMQGRLAIRSAQTEEELEQANALVHAAKVGLGERGPVWWDGDAEDYSGLDPTRTPYADWWRSLSDENQRDAD